MKLFAVNIWRLGLPTLLVAAAFLLYLPSETAASLTVSPDSSEYAISLSNLFEHGVFGFTLNGEWYPSRYAPWFSLSCLSPAYLLSGGDTLCYHWAMLAFALFSLFLVYNHGRRIGLSGWSFVLPVLLLLLPDFVFYSRVVMTEVPYLAVFLLASLLFARFVAEDEPGPWPCLFAGLAVAWCGMIRSTGLPMVLPFVVVLFVRKRSWTKFAGGLSLLMFPSVLYLAANAIYNDAVFGSPFRNGYHFWVPVPYDFRELVFSVSYIVPALKYYSQQLIMQLTTLFFVVSAVFSGAVLSGRFGGPSKNRVFLSCFGFGGVQFGVLVLLYSGYYWLDTRFFLVATIYFLPLFLYSVYAVMRRLLSDRSVLVFPIVPVLCAVVFLMCPARFIGMTVGRPIWLAEARMTAGVLPEGSVVIQNGDPNVMDHFGFRTRKLRLLPLARRFDYVKFMVALSPIHDKVACPEWNRDDWKRTIIPEFISEGVCCLPFDYTFFENPERVRYWLENGVRVFYQQDSWFEEELLPEFDRVLSSIGVKRVPFAVRTLDELPSNPLRHWYDELVFPGYFMDSRPKIDMEYFELTLIGK